MNAHPVGCEKEVERQIEYVKSKGALEGPKKVLVIGSSTGYGLASRIVSAFGCGASTIGVAFEKEASGKRTGTAGYYNTAAFDKKAEEAGLYTKSFNGDAFSHEMKQQVIETIKNDLGKVDFVVYSLASGIRVDPDTGETYKSVLKSLGDEYSAKSIDLMKGVITEATISAANPEEAVATVKVMGGEDWSLWIKALREADVLAEGAQTVAYSYIGPNLTHAIYREGTIGKAKEHLEATAKELDEQMKEIHGRAVVSVNKALITRASAVIPMVALYTSILYKIMKKKGSHEGCIEQMHRLYKDKMFGSEGFVLDSSGLIRVDDWEMEEDVQKEVEGLFFNVTDENISEIADLEGARLDFFQLNGFQVDGVDYDADVQP